MALIPNRHGTSVRKRGIRLFRVHQGHERFDVRTLLRYWHRTNADDIPYSKADFLQNAGSKTPIFIRFSTVTLGREFPDSARNPRGFAIKFYTGEGNYDIVGLNWVNSPSNYPSKPFLTSIAHLFLSRPNPRSRCHSIAIPESKELPLGLRCHL